ncbi:TPA: virulence regulator [Neisseria subflava]
MLNLSAPVLKEIELLHDAGLSVGAIVAVLRLKFPVELHDQEDKKIEEAVLLMINPPRKAPSLSR